MTARLPSLSPARVAALAIGAVLMYAAVVWFAVVSPKRSEVSSLGREIVAAELRLTEAEAAANRRRAEGTPVSDVFRLAKAMPGSDDQPGLVLELNRLARSSGVVLRSITTQAPLAGAGGATMVPVVVTVGGSYFDIAKFLQRMRILVEVRDGKLHARGRLLAVEKVELDESVTEGFPLLDATVTLNSYVYDGPVLAADGGEAPQAELTPMGETSAAGRTG